MHTTIRKRQICVTGDSLLRKTDTPVIRPTPENGAVCCQSQPQQLGLKWIQREGSTCHIDTFLSVWIQDDMAGRERQKTFFNWGGKKKKGGYVIQQLQGKVWGDEGLVPWRRSASAPMLGFTEKSLKGDYSGKNRFPNQERWWKCHWIMTLDPQKVF